MDAKTGTAYESDTVGFHTSSQACRPQQSEAMPDTLPQSKMTIREMMAGQKVLITGGTGFIGKVFLEKLLRDCELDTVYLAMREKKGLSQQERINQIFQLPLFDNLKKIKPDAVKKIKIISANLKEPNLGIPKADRQEIIKNVTLVYHIAATVQFNDNIIDTLEQNTKATFLMMELAKQIENLQVLMYVSTCYTNFFRPKAEWDEGLYPPVQDWRAILRLLETQPLQLAMMKEKLLCGHPNPYTFSKALAEQIVADYSNHFKATVIVRPSVVISALEEPLRGWTDSLNGVAALCIANSFGILRVIMHNSEAHQDYVPVDFVSRFLPVATWAAVSRKKEDYPLIYNCTIGELVTLRTSDLSRISFQRKIVENIPSKYIVWTRQFRMVGNRFMYQVHFTLEQILPACFLDLAIHLYGGKPMFLKLMKKFSFASQILFKDFNFAQVHFKNDKFIELVKNMEGENKDYFGISQLEDVSKITLENILVDMYVGVLKYYFKEDLSEKSIIKNKKRYQRIVMMDKTLRIIFYASLGYFFYCILQSDMAWSYFNSLSSTIIGQ